MLGTMLYVNFFIYYVEELTYIDVETKLNEAIALFSGPIPPIINDCHGLTVLADSFLILPKS